MVVSGNARARSSSTARLAYRSSAVHGAVVATRGRGDIAAQPVTEPISMARPASTPGEHLILAALVGPVAIGAFRHCRSARARRLK